MTRSVLLLISDTHAGHKLALCPPNVVLYDEDEVGNLVPYTPELTAFQQVLLKLLEERIIPTAIELAGYDPIDMIHLGDPTHGNKYPEQLITTRLADQIEIAFATYSLIIPQLPTLRLLRSVVGTTPHEFGEGSATIMIANRLAEKYPGLDVRPLYHGLLNIGGCLIDYSHHGPGSSQRIWLEGNAARFYLKDIMMREILAGREPPRLVARGHIHTQVNEVVTHGEHESRLIVCPSMCGLGDHARQVTRSIPSITVGVTLIEIINGQPLKPVWITETFDIRTKENLL